MPNRSLDGNYRYKFQGQEKDAETGMEAFELRLWDNRIGRWLTVDPYGQYASPYLGMGNNPISMIDPDGGWKTKWGRFWAWVGNGFRGNFVNSEVATGNKKYGLAFDYGGDESGELTGTFMAFSKSALDSWNMNQKINNWAFTSDGKGVDMDVITPTKILSNFQFWRDSPNEGIGYILLKTGVELTYGSADNVYTVFSGGKTIAGEQLQGYHRSNAGVDGITTLWTAGYSASVKSLKMLKSSPALYNEFARKTKGLFSGSNHAKLRKEAYKEMIRKHNTFVKDMKDIFNIWDVSRDVMDVINVIKD